MEGKNQKSIQMNPKLPSITPAISSRKAALAQVRGHVKESQSGKVFGTLKVSYILAGTWNNDTDVDSYHKHTINQYPKDKGIKTTKPYHRQLANKQGLVPTY